MEPIQTHCPICDHSVTKIKESDRELKNKVVCTNEFYIHYVDHDGNHILNKFHEAKTREPKDRFGI